MTSVGIRQLKNHLSQYLRRVSAGERVVVTERGRPLAIIAPSIGTAGDRRVEALVRAGLAHWGGGKPRGARRPVRIRGRSIARTVIEGRR